MRLSREDGDKAESDSILNQQRLLDDFCSSHPEFAVVDHYTPTTATPAPPSSAPPSSG